MRWLVGVSFFICVSVNAAWIEFSSVESNVPYSQVAALAFNNADAKLSYGADPLQFGLLWKARPSKLTEDQLPNQKKLINTKPLVVLIHGGCWLNAYDIKHTYPLATAISQAGFNVWSIEYRRTGDEGGAWPGTFQDIMLSLSQLDQLKTQNIDTGKFILLGHSAGGHLALLAAEKLQNTQNGNQLLATIGLAAITDIITYAKGTNSCQTATEKFMQLSYQQNPKIYEDANPVQKNLPATSLLLQGDQDSIVPLSQATNSKIKQKIVKDAGHFDWIHPGSEAFKLLIQQLDIVSQ